jgi:gluconolactonase
VLKPKHVFWLLPVTGLAALVWFLIRVIPKPSRALYPCQRVAFPIASGFVVWLISLAGAITAFKKGRNLLKQSRLLLACGCLMVAVGLGMAAIINMPEKQVLAGQQNSLSPIGEAKGIFPGRVVWVHNPDATDWQGPGNDHWWEKGHTNQAVVEKMLSQSIQAVAGETTDAAAWDKLFRYLNKTRGKGDVGYKGGEKVVIKVNFVGMIMRGGGVNSETYSLDNQQDYMNTSPQAIIAVLRQLVGAVGVKQSDITVCDSLAHFANQYYDILKKEFPDVIYGDGGGKFGRVKMQPSAVPFYWSCRPQGITQDYIPTAYVEAEYLINLANLKAHTGAGVTLCAKNHFGSLARTPVQKGYYDMHKNAFSEGTGMYRPLVDLMGHAHIGGKTVLYLIDGLYCGTHPIDRAPSKWKSPPFNGDWTSSIFASQDPVAIDSVGLDFLQAEYEKHPRKNGVDDYLREAALADNPPSGTFYDPDHQTNVKKLSSLGVHEHWNNPNEKKYTRNLGSAKGIELVALGQTAAPAKTGVVAEGAKLTKLADTFKFTEGPAVDSEGNVFFTDQPNNRIHKWSIDGKLSVFLNDAGRSNGLYFDKSGNLYACADLNNELWMIDTKGKVTVLVKDYKGKKLNGPNDLWIDPKGGIYFTDPFYKRDYWKRGPMEQDGQHVYYFSPDRKTLIRVTNDLVQPNGIIGTPDGKMIYVADIGGRKTYSYTINTDGTLSNKKLLTSMGSDGMTIDNEGNIYLTGKGVTVFNSAGEKIEQIDVPAGWTANVTFGGKDRQTLFITAQTSLYSIRMRTKGV